MIEENELYDVECPGCSSSDIEIDRWTDLSRHEINFRVECDCGFNKHNAYSAREFSMAILNEDVGEFPIETVHNGGEGSAFRVELKFSPRQFLGLDNPNHNYRVDCSGCGWGQTYQTRNSEKSAKAALSAHVGNSDCSVSEVGVEQA